MKFRAYKSGFKGCKEFDTIIAAKTPGQAGALWAATVSENYYGDMSMFWSVLVKCRSVRSPKHDCLIESTISEAVILQPCAN